MYSYIVLNMTWETFLNTWVRMKASKYCTRPVSVVLLYGNISTDQICRRACDTELSQFPFPHSLRYCKQWEHYLPAVNAGTHSLLSFHSQGSFEQFNVHISFHRLYIQFYFSILGHVRLRKPLSNEYVRAPMIFCKIWSVAGKKIQIMFLYM